MNIQALLRADVWLTKNMKTSKSQLEFNVRVYSVCVGSNAYAKFLKIVHRTYDKCTSLLSKSYAINGFSKNRTPVLCTFASSFFVYMCVCVYVTLFCCKCVTTTTHTFYVYVLRG